MTPEVPSSVQALETADAGHTAVAWTLRIWLGRDGHLALHVSDADNHPKDGIAVVLRGAADLLDGEV